MAKRTANFNISHHGVGRTTSPSDLLCQEGEGKVDADEGAQRSHRHIYCLVVRCVTTRIGTGPVEIVVEKAIEVAGKLAV